MAFVPLIPIGDALAKVADDRTVAEHREALAALEALRGLVPAAAVRRLRSKQDAFRLFGKEATVSNRNHGKVLRAEIARVAALCEALGQPADPDLDALITSSEP